MEEIKLEREISSLGKSFERAKTKRTHIEEYFDTKMEKLNNNLQEMEADLKKMIDKDHVEVSTFSFSSAYIEVPVPSLGYSLSGRSTSPYTFDVKLISDE